MSGWWVASFVAHLTVGAGLSAGVQEAEIREPPSDEVRFVPPPTEAEVLESAAQEKRGSTLASRRVNAPERTTPRRDVRETQGLGGRIGARADSSAVGGSDAAAALRSRRPRQESAASLRAKARRAAARAVDAWVKGLSTGEEIPDETALAMVIERAAQTHRQATTSHRGERGRPRLAPRGAMSTVPVGDEGMGATGAPDTDRVGDTLRMDTDLIHRHPYWKAVYDKVQPLWSFPPWAEERMMQGEVHVALEFDHKTGAVHDVEVVRSSRIDDFDANVVRAVRQASPFGPVPPDAPRARRIVWPFKFSNPIF